MLKIGVSYINAENLGDQIIYQTARFLVEKSLKENGINDYEILPVDICLTDKFDKSKHATAEEYLAREEIRRAEEAKIIERIRAAETEEEIQQIENEAWVKTPLYSDFMATQEKLLHDLDLFVFAGGGLIKFHAQYFHHIIDEITKKCEERNVSVLFLSVGVEGYDNADARCRLLKKALNRDCVKYISVRDDIQTFMNFMTNPDIKVELVADPAFWTRERYRIAEIKPQKGLIGLNGIRQAIWEFYLYKDVERSMLHEIYHDLIIRLTEEGYHVEVFSNGVHGDRDFLEGMIRAYDDLKALKEDKILTTYYPDNPRRLIKRISQYERFMGVRLHSSIVGSVLGVPNVNLVWCIKQILFGKQTGTSGNFLLRDDFNADIIYDRLMNVKPYVIDEAYKASVYDGLNDQIKRFLGGQYSE